MLPLRQVPIRWRPALRAFLVAGPAAAIVLLASGLPHAQTPPADRLSGSSPHSKLNRQLDIFERVIDDVLIDSEHALVNPGRNAHGAYLPGQGAIFTLEFSLVGPSWGPVVSVGDGKFHVFRDDDDLGYIEFDDDDDNDDDEDKDKEERKRDRDRERRRQRVRIGPDHRWTTLDDDELKEHRTRQYGKVKEELIETLGENGDVLDGIPADEWVTVVARPRDLPWGERKVKRLVIRARVRDVIERAEGRMAEAAFRERVVIEEYK